MKIVIEPSAAVGVAVVLYSKAFAQVSGLKNVGIVLCGGESKGASFVIVCFFTFSQTFADVAGNIDLDQPLPWQR
jgi:hypothetical protein